MIRYYLLLFFFLLVMMRVNAQTTAIEWTGQTVTDEISFGTISADASFSEAVDWSYLVFLNLNDGGGNKSFASMYGSSTNRQINFYVPSSASNLAVRADLNNLTVSVTTDEVMSLNTWYLVMLSNDASESDNFRIFIMDMNGALVDSTSSTAFTSDHGLNAELVLGNRNTIHAYRGSMAYASYFSAYYGLTEMGEYIVNPTGFLASNTADNEFFLSLSDTVGHGNTHTDEGPTGNNGTEGNAGTLIQDSDGPVLPAGVSAAVSTNRYRKYSRYQDY